MHTHHEYPATLLKTRLPNIDYYEDIQADINKCNDLCGAFVAMQMEQQGLEADDEFDIERDMNSAMHRALSERIVAHTLEEVFSRSPRAIETMSMYIADFSTSLEWNTPTYALEVEHVDTTHRSLEEAIDALNSHSTTIPENVHTDALSIKRQYPTAKISYLRKGWRGNTESADND